MKVVPLEKKLGDYLVQIRYAVVLDQYTCRNETPTFGLILTDFIRHGAVVCRIVNWKGLTAYNVTSL